MLLFGGMKLKKYIIGIALFSTIMACTAVKASIEQSSNSHSEPSSEIQVKETLQSMIDATPTYGVVKVPSGSYQENIIISKPIAIEGVGDVTIRSCSAKPVVTIKNHAVTMRNIAIQQCNHTEGMAAIHITGDNHHLDQLKIKTKQFGIKLDHAQNVAINNSSIHGEETGNGIDLWKSNATTIEGSKIANVRDGIYMEKSNSIEIKQSNIQHSRYGVHVMYSDNVSILNNTSRDNHTGAMVMETNGTKIIGNRLLDNKRNVHSQGLLMYGVRNTVIKDNQINHNRIGLYVENTNNNRILSNFFMGNFIGIQFNHGNGNNVSGNSFIGNVNELQAIESLLNNINQNYWDGAVKLDASNTGFSAIPYRADPFFLSLTTEIPEFQLFFQSPGMVILQKMLKSPDGQILMDMTPAMSIPQYRKDVNSSSERGVGALAFIMLLLGIGIFIVGRKRR